MTAFFNMLKDKIQLSEKSREAFLSVMRNEEYPRGHLLVKPGTVCRSFFFVEKGLTRTFYYKDGKDVTDWFSPENTIACSIVSFTTQKPDRRGIELLEDSSFWVLDHDDLEMLCSQYHEIERFARLSTAYGMILVQERFDDLHFATAAERYKKLLEHQPTILQRAPLGMVASYLGITQETLSRIRSQHIF
jgi:CRP-like cAMP-binding protein